MKTCSLFLAVIAFPAGLLQADITLPSIISDHMVLAKVEKVPIWGKADPEENVSVSLQGQTVSTKADDAGRWSVSLNLKVSTPGPYEMRVEGKNQLTISDVLVGEVWLASGQSNMGWILKNTNNADAEIAASGNSLIRVFTVKSTAAATPQDDVEGKWVMASPDTSGWFSAVGYFFARMLQKELQVPVGLINSSWGGTPSEAWTSAEAMDSVPDLKAARERQVAVFQAYPDKHKAYVDGMGAWIKTHSREDKPVADAAAFAGGDVNTDDWVSVTLPGEVKAPGLTEGGAVWLRKDVEITTKETVGLTLPINGYDSVYWNGKLLAQTTYQDFPGTGFVRRSGPYSIPKDSVNVGKNVLAIRLYQPVGPTKIPADPQAGYTSLKGEWLAKTEYEFPPLDAATLAAAPEPPVNAPAPQSIAGFLFQGMINPLIPFAINGAIWYQGESNAGRAYQYQTAFPLLIKDWRAQWKQGNFPFYFCQLANYLPKKPVPAESAWAELREAQSKTLGLPNTGQAVIIDLGESKDIHPRNKKDVGERLARIALAKDYGKSVPYSGPVFEALTIKENQAILTFQHAEGGLVAQPLGETYDVKTLTRETAPLVRNSPTSQLEGFAICGEDKVWVWAYAKIDGEKVIVTSEKVPNPVAVRYAWADNPTCNLANADGLPASPFRTDDFPLTTLDKKF